MGIKFFKKRKKVLEYDELQSQIDAINRGEYWDSGGKKNPELNQSDSISVRQRKVKELQDYHKNIELKKKQTK